MVSGFKWSYKNSIIAESAMKPANKLDFSQLQLLQLIVIQREANLLKARNNLSWDVERFAVALHGLEAAMLINRSGFKAMPTAAGITALLETSSPMVVNPLLSGASHSYIDGVKSPRISVNEYWLPNFEKFSRAMQFYK